VSRFGHTYRNGVRGRSLAARPDAGVIVPVAKLKCSGCPEVGEVVLRRIMPPDQIDRKFTQAGWRLDPNLCPECIRKNAASKEKKMATLTAKPTQAAMKAQTVMFRLLSDHFDTEEGRFEPGWDDARIAKETDLSRDVVSEYRRAGFGEIKESPEIAGLRADITSLDNLAREQHGAVTAEIASLRSRLMKIEQGAAR
jgi:hypothetical protein